MTRPNNPKGGGAQGAVIRPATLLRYDGIKALADTLGRPASTLIALAGINDPFAITPARREGAQWFARVWRRLDLGSGMHLRRVHYRLVSQDRPVRLPNGMPFENTHEAWQALIRASNDARFLDLVAAEDFVDRRNAEPLIYLPDGSDEDALLSVNFGEPYIAASPEPTMPLLPELGLVRPMILQPYHVEIWCEKTTINDILEPLARQYGLNVVTGAGELSQTACVNVVERAEASQRPVRIIYASDHDPAGSSMPVAVARKIEHRLYLNNLLGLDIQVRPVVLTLEQCRAIPPAARTDQDDGAARRRVRGAQRRGRGRARRARSAAPRRAAKDPRAGDPAIFDADLDDAVASTARKTERSLAEITRGVHAEHLSEIDALRSQWTEINRDHAGKIAQWRKAAKPTWRAIEKELKARAPDPDDVDWPKPADGDEDDDPLFDSTRGYVEQIDRYKLHQGKPTTRRGAPVPDDAEDAT